MDYIERRGNLWYAVYYVPTDVQPIIGKKKYLRSTKTSNRKEAVRTARPMVALWEAEVYKARGQQPNSNYDFWPALRRQYMAADEDTQLVLEGMAEEAASKLDNPEDAGLLFRMATGQGTAAPLAPLVDDWRGTLRLAQKTMDQQYRDMKRLATHFEYLERLQPQKIKVWTDKLLAEGTTAATFERLGNGCRSLWAYFQQASVVSMIAPDPFAGAFKLALRVAVKTNTGRSNSSYTPDELNSIYVAAIAKKDQTLADLIALGAYSGARIEELGRLTKETCVDGIFNIKISKTAAGIRRVPIHPAVAPLVNRMLAASTDGCLVPSTAKNQYGNRTDNLGKRYGSLKTKLGFGASHVFHTTRNTLVTMMHQAGADEGIAADTVGHDRRTLTYGLYSSGSSLKQKRDAIALVVYGGALASP